MPSYAYVALDAHGGESRGALEVRTLDEAVRRLREMGLFPTCVVEHRLRAPGSHAFDTDVFLLASRLATAAGRALRQRVSLRLPARHLTLFTRQVATFIEAGLPLLRGLRLLEQQETRPGLRRVINDVCDSIENGSTFSQALALHPRAFNRLFVSMVKAGEASGALDAVLARLASFMERSQRLKDRVIGALYYPLAVLFVASGVTTLLMLYVLPRFRTVFEGMAVGARLPAFTEFVFRLSDLAVKHAPALVVAAAVVALAVRWLKRTPQGLFAWDYLKLHVPVFGLLFRKVAVARFTRTLGTLLGSGVPVLQALTIVKESAGNALLARAVHAVHESVKQGDSLAGPLRASSLFPPLVTGMVEVGEQTGALPEMLTRIADRYEDEVDTAAGALTSLLEPVMILFLAVVVGGIVIAMFLPLLGAAAMLSGSANPVTD